MSKKIIISIFTIVFAITGLVGVQMNNSNNFNKVSSAQAVNSCSTAETLVGTNCVSTRNAHPIFELKCPAGTSPLDAVCVKSTPKTCADFPSSVNAENGLCKISDVNAVLLSAVQDEDGRQCNGTGYNFKKYNNTVICANTYSAVFGKENFRFVPSSVTQITNLEVAQTSIVYGPCAPNAVVSETTKCSVASTVTGCNQAGEYLNGSVCTICPANKYCSTDAPVTSTTSYCPNGGRLLGGECVADLKYSYTDYTTGCANGYVTLDQTCAIYEVRTHDLACSYFYVSDDATKKAILDTDGRHCVTNGGNFASVSIIKVSDLQCDGPGTAWYNYNVAFDPLVCGNNFSVVGASGFRWLADTYTKITPLQKLPFQVKTCPAGWTSVNANTNDCVQPALKIVVLAPRDCPVGTTSVAGSGSLASCITVVVPTSSSSSAPASSSVVSSSVSSSVVSSSVVSSSSSTPASSSVVSSSSLAPASSSVVSSSSSTPASSSSSSLVSSSVSSSSTSSSSPTPVAAVCTITGKIYVDTNKNGIQDSNEPDGNIPAGTTISFADANAVRTVSYDVNGNYTVSNLNCNASYSVIVYAPSGYTVSNSTENGSGTGSNPTTITLNTNTSTTFNIGKDGLYKNDSTVVVTPVTPVNPISNLINIINNNTNINNNIFGNNNTVSNNVSNTNNTSGNTTTGTSGYNYGYNIIPFVNNNNSNNNNNNFATVATIGYNTGSNSNTVTNTVSNNNSSNANANNNTNVNNNIVGTSSANTVIVTTGTNTNSNSNTNTNVNTNGNTVTQTTTTMPGVNTNTNSNTNSNVNTNTQTTTIRTGGLSVIATIAAVTTLAGTALLFTLKRNRKLVNPIR
jgi:hypothetical protein